MAGDHDCVRISSRRNPLVRQLRQLHNPRGRREQQCWLLEGTHLLQEVLRLERTPQLILATERWRQRYPHLLKRLVGQCRVVDVSEEVLAAVATTGHPDGVVLTLNASPTLDLGDCSGLVLALDTIQDPGNLGTLMRTALAAGAEALWLADGADPFQPKVLRASAGAALALPLWRGDRAALVQQLRVLLARGSTQLVSTVPPGQQAQPYWTLDWTLPTVLMLGSEGAGLAPELTAVATHHITIPHSAAVESLNVAVAAAPLLLERERQQRTGVPLPLRGENAAN
jgi:TrmH family RNA methyltransferase